MMRGQANENILTLMASIEGLHTQATNSDIRQTPHQNRTAQSPMDLDEPAMADHEVVHLNTIFAGQPTGQVQGRDRDRGTSLLHPGIGHLLPARIVVMILMLSWLNL